MAKRTRKRKQHEPESDAEAIDPEGLRAWERRHLTWMASRGYADSTVRNREIGVDRFIAWCHGRGLHRPEDISKPILERYRTHLFHYRNPSHGKPLSFSSQAVLLVAVKLFFKWLTQQNVLLWNPASELELPRTPKQRPRQTLTVEEVEAVLAQPDVTEPIGLRDRTIIEVLYATGMRRAELAGLSVFDFDEGRRALLIRHAKGGRYRVVPVGERAALWLRKYLDDARPQLVLAPDEGMLFLTNLGERFPLKRLSSLVRTYVKHAGIDKPGSCHLLRHTAATLMLEHGADIRYIQQLLGHADLSTTEVYTRVNIDQLTRVHALTHPGARLRFTAPEQPGDGLRVAAVADVLDDDDDRDDAEQGDDNGDT